MQEKNRIMEENQEVVAVESASKAATNFKVLVAEDNKIARKIIENELATIEANVISVNDGAEAVNIAEKERPDIIIMEIELPTMNGFDACRKLKNNYNTRNIPIIFITQIDSEEERKMAYAAGAVDYLVTPLKKGKLASKIQKQLDIKIGADPQNILIVEDSLTIRTVIKNILLKERHTVIEAEDGMIAWEILKKRKDIDIILTDINMPNMDGYQLCNLIKGDKDLALVPVIVISTMADKDDIATLLNAGADDYIIKPFATLEFLSRLAAHIRVKELYKDMNIANEKLKNFNESLEKMVEFRTQELNEANMESVMMLAVASEHRDTDTGNHVRRIQEFSKAIALAMGYSLSKAEEIGYSSILHDVGKIAIPDSILKKPGKLTDEEFKQMQKHTVLGEAIVSKNQFFKVAREVARSHHEKFDGTGYPDGLSDYAIPLSARIVSVADVFDALTQKRVYKDAWPEEKAYDLINKATGKEFDPLVVESFKSIYRDGTASKIKGKYK